LGSCAAFLKKAAQDFENRAHLFEKAAWFSRKRAGSGFFGAAIFQTVHGFSKTVQGFCFSMQHFSRPCTVLEKGAGFGIFHAAFFPRLHGLEKGCTVFRKGCTVLDFPCSNFSDRAWFFQKCAGEKIPQHGAAETRHALLFCQQRVQKFQQLCGDVERGPRHRKGILRHRFASPRLAAVEFLRSWR
jgi:hypothetical protein